MSVKRYKIILYRINNVKSNKKNNFIIWVLVINKSFGILYFKKLILKMNNNNI